MKCLLKEFPSLPYAANFKINNKQLSKEKGNHHGKKLDLFSITTSDMLHVPHG